MIQGSNHGKSFKAERLHRQTNMPIANQLLLLIKNIYTFDLSLFSILIVEIGIPCVGMLKMPVGYSENKLYIIYNLYKYICI